MASTALAIEQSSWTGDAVTHKFPPVPVEAMCEELKTLFVSPTRDAARRLRNTTVVLQLVMKPTPRRDAAMLVGAFRWLAGRSRPL